MKIKFAFIWLVFVCYSIAGRSEIKLPAVFSDNMVLQQQTDAPFWGWAEPGEEITIKGNWNENVRVHTTANNDGKWMVKLKTPKAGGPYSVTISGSQTIVLQQVMIGEVWICSGQSNMEMPLKGWAQAPVTNSEAAISTADYPDIRLFTVKRNIALEPQEDCEGAWSACSRETVSDFSATAYFFGRALYRRLKVPIGLIHTSWGGTVAEAWTSGPALRQLGDFNKALDRRDSILQRNKTIEEQKAVKKNHNMPTGLYNGMVSPLIPFAIKGVIWYQGESNVNRAAQYTRLFPAMITDWRSRWQAGDFPFYFVQIAPYNYKGNGWQSAALRDAQRRTLSLSNTGMAVTLDIGDTVNIHPANKEEVGRRLSLWALAKTYGVKGIEPSGPLYRGMKIRGQKIIISFDHRKKGLIARGGALTYFEVAGKDGKFVPAKAAIKKGRVVVYADGVDHPVAVRYAWSDKAVPHLFNQSGLPASSFSTAWE